MTKLAISGGTPLWSGSWPTWPIFSTRERELLEEVLNSGVWAYDGPREAKFSAAFAEYQTATFGIAVANGTIALQLALEALDIGFGDEVIVPVNTWQATAAACLDVNAVPILVDIEPDSYCIDPAQVEAHITPRTRAIIPVHLYNSTANMDALLAIAQRHGLAIIEDCAHSHGTLWQEKGVGSIGDIGCFSFQSSKSLNAGEGGFITTNDPRLYERLYSLRNCGRQRPGADPATWEPVQSGNYRISEWQAAILLAQFERLPAHVARREANMHFLDEQLSQIDGLKPLVHRPQATRQGMYAYVFRYQAQQFQDLPAHLFRQALAAELGTRIGNIYEPLNNSPLYQPHTKRRYHLSEEHWRAIDPTRFQTPVATNAFATEAVVISQPHLLADVEAMQAIAEACAKIQANAAELVAWAKATQSTGQPMRP